MKMMCELKHDEHTHDHDHSHGGKSEVILFFIGLGAFFIALFVKAGMLETILYIAVLILSGYHVMVEGFLDTIHQTIKRKKFMPNIHILKIGRASCRERVYISV